MKKLLLLIIVLLITFPVVSQTEITMDNIDYYTADLAEAANYKSLENARDPNGNLKYPGFVDALKRVAKGYTTGSTRYVELNNFMAGYATVVEIDPSRKRNRRLRHLDRDMTILNQNLNGHKMVYDNVTGVVALAGCGNVVVNGMVYHLPISGLVKTAPNITYTPSVVTNPDPVDCNCPEKKDPVVKLDPDLPSYSAGAYSGYNANFGAVPNQIPGTDFSQVTIVKEKGKYGWIWKTLAGVAIGYFLTDGLSDGEWFDFNFEKPQTIVVDGPPGGPDLNPSSLIMRTSNYQLQQQLQSMMPQNNAPPSIGFSFNIGL